MGYQNLVFEGGGVKGIAYGGALSVLHEKGILEGIKRVAGTSAGAINAVLLAVGYNHMEVSNIIAKTNFNDFADDSFLFLRDINRLVTEYGWNKGDAFKKWIGRLIENKVGNRDLTFGELVKIPGSKELYLIATNLSDQKVEIFSHETTPDVPIKDAVRMSMSIPFFFKCVRYGSDNDVYVDGGVSLNYPINIFDNKKYLQQQGNGEPVEYNQSEGYVFNHETLGFRLDSQEEIELGKLDWSSVPAEIDSLHDFTKSLLNFIYEMANKKHLHKNDWNRTIAINTFKVDATDFDISKDTIEELIKSGKQGVISYLDWKDTSGTNKPI